MILQKKVLKIFSDVIPVKGYKRSVLFDLNRHHYHFIPNGLFYIIENFQGRTLDEIYSNFEKSEEKIINSYIKYLIENDFAFMCDLVDFNLYSEISLKWDFPGLISNAIIELDCNFNSNIFLKIINQLEELGCKHIQFISKEIVQIPKIEEILKCFSDSRFLSIEFIIPWNKNDKNDLYIKLIKQYPRIKSFIIWGAPFDKVLTESTIGAMGNLLFTNKQLPLPLEKREFGYFSVNMEIFTEGLEHHLFFNRKVVFDKMGNIKNHLDSDEMFGNIKKDNLKRIITSQALKKMWFVNKDKIEICRDCEFRYVCVDDRLDLVKTQSGYRYNSECQYNPYIAKHNKQVGYITVKEWQEQQKNISIT